MDGVGLLTERSVGDQDALSAQLGAVREMPGLEGIELVIRHVRRVGWAAQQDERIDVERVRDVRVARHGATGYRAIMSSGEGSGGRRSSGESGSPDAVPVAQTAPVGPDGLAA